MNYWINKTDQIINIDGNTSWYKNGQLHRDNDLPAVIWNDGSQFWYQYGKRHRDNDLPAVILTNGSQFWYQYGKFIKRKTVAQTGRILDELF